MMTLVWKEMGPSIGWEVYNSTELPVSFLLKWEQTAASHCHGQSFLPGQIMSSNCKSKPLLSCRVLSHSSKVSLTQYRPLPSCNGVLSCSIASPALLLSIHDGDLPASSCVSRTGMMHRPSLSAGGVGN